MAGIRKQYLVEFGLKSNIQALGEYFELYKTRTMTFSIGLLLIAMLTIKYRNLVIDFGNGVKTKAQLTLPY